MLKSLLRPETPLCKQRIGDTDVPHYDLKDWTKWGPREDGELEGDVELETAEVQCAPVHCLGCSFRSAPSIYCHVMTGRNLRFYINHYTYCCKYCVWNGPPSCTMQCCSADRKCSLNCAEMKKRPKKVKKENFQKNKNIKTIEYIKELPACYLSE